MTRPTLTEQIDSIQYSESACDLFAYLTEFSATDEGAAIILVAAAALLAREHPGLTPDDQNGLRRLTAEFSDLVFAARDELAGARCYPALHLVGGTDA